MPICTTCTHKIPYLYTVYESANNLRLEQCPKCLNFVDPYVEHDTLILLLDLILLKRGVFRHLLFNRGYEPRKATKDATSSEVDEKTRNRHIEAKREKDRWNLIFQLGIVLIFLDAFIRWSHLSVTNEQGDNNTSFLWTREHVEPLLRIFAGCIIETIAFHIGITLTSAAVLKAISLWQSTFKSGNSHQSTVREQLRLSHVPLTLLYSSLTKLFLLLLLALWKPSTASSNHPSLYRGMNGTEERGGLLHDLMAHDFTQKALDILDDDKLDREWVVRNVLGGMAAGFGLRVVLDIQPIFTTLIILTGWAAKTFVANLVSTWVDKGGSTGDVFLAYSIP